MAARKRATTRKRTTTRKSPHRKGAKKAAVGKKKKPVLMGSAGLFKKPKRKVGSVKKSGTAKPKRKGAKKGATTAKRNYVTVKPKKRPGQGKIKKPTAPGRKAIAPTYAGNPNGYPKTKKQAKKQKKRVLKSLNPKKYNQNYRQYGM